MEGSSSRGYPHTEVRTLSQDNQIRLLRQLTGSDVNASGMPVVHVPALLNWILSLGVGRLSAVRVLHEINLPCPLPPAPALALV